MRVRTLVLSCCVWLGAGGFWGCKVDVGSEDDDSNSGERDAGPKGGKGEPINAGKGAGGKGAPINAGRGSQGGTSGGTDAGTSRAGSSGGGDLPGSISPDDQLSELSASDATALCQAIGAEVSEAVSAEDFKRLNCTLSAIALQMTETEACEQFVEDCIAEATGDPITEEMCDADELLGQVEGCSTTVGEYQECVQATARQLAEAFEAFTCETLADPDVAEEALNGAGSNPPECVAVALECPALVGEEEPMTPEDGCSDECLFYDDGECDDGGEGSTSDLCPLGTDCTDCGTRQ